MSERGNKKTMIGLVASDKMNKTVVVEVTRRTIHPMYHKYIKRRKRYHAHDETNDCQVGDRVLIEECRPMSARKHWRIKQVLERAV
jgi:small subunit ribosomal protein S17